MTTTDSNELPESTPTQLVEALNDMRDALVKASLFLQDHRFDFDPVQRHEAVEHSEKLLKKIGPR